MLAVVVAVERRPEQVGGQGVTGAVDPVGAPPFRRSPAGRPTSSLLLLLSGRRTRDVGDVYGAARGVQGKAARAVSGNRIRE